MRKCLFLLTCLIVLAGINGISQNRDKRWATYQNKSLPDTVRIKALDKIAWGLKNNNPDSAIALATIELNLAEEKDRKNYIGSALNILGYAYATKGNASKALDYFHRALKLFEVTGFDFGAAACYGNIGEVYESQSNYPRALENHLKALKIFEHTKDTLQMAACCGNIGIIYENQTDYPKALEYYQKDLQLALKVHDKLGEAACYTNIGNTYNDQKQYSKAMEYALKSAAATEALGEKLGIASSNISLGIACSNVGDYKSALSRFMKAMGLYRDLGDRHGIDEVYVNMAEYLNKKGDYALAVVYCDSAISLSREIGYVNAQRAANQDKADAYSHAGKYKEAYTSYVAFKALTDSIFNAENSKQLGDMKTSFEVEKKEAELKAKADQRQAVVAEEEKRQSLVIYAVAGVLLLLIIFSSLLYKRFRLTNTQKKIIEIKNRETEEQKHLIEEKHREITDSINYAERIQRALLASKKMLDQNLGEYFVLFKPKDVVSGDFYWASRLANNQFIIATADSTGHGVPGAIMSILNIACLDKAVTKGIASPDLIFNETRRLIIENLKNDGSSGGGKDGMDGSLISFDFAGSSLSCALANNPVWIVRGKELIELKPDRMPVGKHDKDQTPFSLVTRALEKGDMVYALTDGYADQFGGPNGKKFKYRPLQDLLLSVSAETPEKQKHYVSEAFEVWKGDLEQVDDVCLIGVRV